MGVNIEIFKGKGFQPWRFRVRSRNNQIISTSEGYLTKWNAKRSARKIFPNHEIKELDAKKD